MNGAEPPRHVLQPERVHGIWRTILRLIEATRCAHGQDGLSREGTPSFIYAASPRPRNWSTFSKRCTGLVVRFPLRETISFTKTVAVACRFSFRKTGPVGVSKRSLSRAARYLAPPS